MFLLFEYNDCIQTQHQYIFDYLVCHDFDTLNSPRGGGFGVLKKISENI
jgi:hypothetical protein